MEVMPPLWIDQKLRCPRILVLAVLRDFDGVGQDALAQVFVQIRGRGDLHNFLVSPLYRAIPLKEVHHVPLGVSHELDFDMPRLLDVPLDETRTVPKGV